MAVCRGGLQIALESGSLAGARIQTLGTLSSNRSVGIAQRARRLNRQNCVSAPRKMQSVSVKAIADVATEYYGIASEEEMFRRADSYFATDSRPIVLFDGTNSHLSGIRCSACPSLSDRNSNLLEFVSTELTSFCTVVDFILLVVRTVH